jgi:hypothetical protein
MAGEDDDKAPESPNFEDNFFVLAGWTASNLGERMVLKLQGVQAGKPDAPNTVKQTEFYLNRTQAAQLGQFLFKASGQAPPKPRTAWLSKLFDR